jgi:hypothetical protein
MKENKDKLGAYCNLFRKFGEEGIKHPNPNPDIFFFFVLFLKKNFNISVYREVRIIIVFVRT